MAEYTKGDWEVAGRAGFGWLVQPNIAVAYGGPNSGREEEGEHNAHLIAAAPNLLEALDGLYAALVHDHNRDLPYWQEAAAAIRKATTGE